MSNSTGALDYTVARPFVPGVVAGWLATHPEDRWQSQDMSLMSADISGFTALSERLARAGREGAEEITAIIDETFERLLLIARDHGGALLKFGGDALLLRFNGDGHASRAAAAAWAMQAAMTKLGDVSTSAGRARLRMSVGIGSGPVVLGLLGEDHRELLVLGPVASRTIACESQAGAGEILVDDVTVAAIGESLVLPAAGNANLLRGAPSAGPAPARGREITDVDLSQAIPRPLRPVVAAELHLSEHRTATVGFVHYDGTDESIEAGKTEALIERLDDLVSFAQRRARDLDVCLLASDVDRDGGKLIFTGGVPVASSRADEHMLLLLREVVDHAGALGLSVRAGAAHGNVFAGEVGSSRRRTYTVMGDTVNLSARVMSQAPPGRLYAVRSVVDAARLTFETEDLEPFQVKGKRAAIQAVAVGRPSGRKASSVAADIGLVGRDEEVQHLLDAVTLSREDGRAAAFELVGEPGVGKTALLRHVARQAEALGVSVVRVETLAHERSVPYAASGWLLRAVLGVEPDATRATLVSALEDTCGRCAARLQPWLPLVARAMQVELRDTPETAALDERFRRARLVEVVADFVAAAVIRPTLVIIDAHDDADDPSVEVIDAVVAALSERPAVTVVARRAARETPVGKEILLGPLSNVDAAELVEVATAETPLRRHHLRAVVSRGAGNPLFLLTLATAALEGEEGLPDSVEALLSERIDRLDPADRWLLRSAAVLGSTFDPLIVGRMGSSLDSSVWSRLDEFIAPATAGRLSFRSALLRDVAYGGLPFASRRRLHGAAGRAIESDAADDDDVAAVLSGHFHAAGMPRKSLHYSELAGRSAASDYANTEAVGFLERAIAAAGKVRTAVKRKAELWELHGVVLRRLNEFDSARRSLARARALLKSDAVEQARLLGEEAQILIDGDSTTQAMRTLTRALGLVADVRGRRARNVEARLEAAYAAALQEQGRYAEALERTNRVLRMRADDPKALVQAHLVAGWASASLNREADLDHFEVAAATARHAGLLKGEAVAHNLSGIARYWAGDWDGAVEQWENARKVQERIGDEVGAADAINNMGEVLSDQGHLEQARRSFLAAERIWRSGGLDSALAYVDSNLGRVAARSGDFVTAHEMYATARAAFAQSQLRGEVVETDARVAEALMLEGRAEEALRCVEEVLAAARALGEATVHRPMLLRIKGLATWLLGDVEGASTTLRQAREAAAGRGADHEEAWTLAAIRLVEGSLDEEAEARLRDLWSQLGIETAPEPVRPGAASAV